MSVVNDTIDWFADSSALERRRRRAAPPGPAPRLHRRDGRDRCAPSRSRSGCGSATPAGCAASPSVSTGALRALPTLGVLTYASLFTGIGIKAAIFTPGPACGPAAARRRLRRARVGRSPDDRCGAGDRHDRVADPDQGRGPVGAAADRRRLPLSHAAGRGDGHGRRIRPRPRWTRSLPDRRPSAVSDYPTRRRGLRRRHRPRARPRRHLRRAPASRTAAPVQPSRPTSA